MKTFGTLALGVSLLASAASAETLVMQSVYPSSLPLLGDSGVNLTKQVETHDPTCRLCRPDWRTQCR
jgi:hypothetical protein